MSDYGLFEADETAQAEPRLAARTAARKLEAAIDVVRRDFGAFLTAATGIDEFGDRWHYSKADIRKAVEPHVFPNTGTMRRIQNAMKQDWKLAHPYKLAEDRDAPVQNLQETYHPSDANLIPEGDFHGYQDSVDQGGPEKVQRDFTPGGDSGSDKHARRQAAGGTYWLYPDHMDKGPKGPGQHHIPDEVQEDYENGIIEREDFDKYDPETGEWIEQNYQGKHRSEPGRHDYDVQAEKERAIEDHPIVLVGPEGIYRDWNGPFGPDGAWDERIDKEAARMVADIYADFAQANGLRVASLDTLDAYAATGIAPADYGLLQAMIVRQAECDEDCDDEDDSEDAESDGEGSNEEPDSDDEGGEPDGDEDDESDYPDSDGDGDHDDDDHHDGGEAPDFGGSDEAPEGGGETFTVPEQAPELDPQLRQEIPQDDPDGSAPIPPEVIDSLLGLPPGTIEQLLLEEVEQGGDPQGGGEGFLGGPGGDNTQPPRMGRRRRQAAPDESEQAMMDRQKRQQRDAIDTKFGPRKPNIQDLYRRAKNGDLDAYGELRGIWNQRGWTASRAARTFWAAEDEQAAPQDPAAGGGDPTAGGGMEPSMMGGAPMMPPPGSQAVQPPAPPQPLEDQPAEDALLDTANQAIMQMIDRETQEYQQIIDPLSQALQAIQFAQQVEQSEHPMDVTPPEGTVNVDPSQAPGGAGNPMQQQANRRRRAAKMGECAGCGDRFPDDDLECLSDLKDYCPDCADEAEGETCPDCGNRPRATGFRGEVLGHEPGCKASKNKKKSTVLRNAARLIAGRYGLSHGGERMLVEAMGRRNYEHVREALQLLPPEHLSQPEHRAAVRHIGEMFAADNPRFNKDVWMRSVLGSASRGRLPFESTRREAGETNVPTPTMDAFEWPNEKPRIDDNNATTDLPKMKGASSKQDVMSRFQRWQNWRQQNGLVVPGGDGAIHDFMQKTRNPAKPKIGDQAADTLHRSMGLEPDAPKAPKARPLKAVNPTLQKSKQPKAPKVGGFDLGDMSFDEEDPSGWPRRPHEHEHVEYEPMEDYEDEPTPPPTPVKRRHVQRPIPRGDYELPPEADPRHNRDLLSNRRDATWGEWEPTKQASFFTRRVPGWKWDDHLNGYISKEGRAFTCSCGQKVAAPSYRTCDCGKVWNVYAIGDTHHLASDSAEMFIAREIPVREGVIMANLKMAKGKCECWDGYCRVPGTEPCAEGSCRKCDSHRKESMVFARLAGDGMSYEDTMRHIDDVLARGEGHDLHHQTGVDPDGVRTDFYDFEDCPHCFGDGADGDDLCPTCNGTGAVGSNSERQCEACDAVAPGDDMECISTGDRVCPECADSIDGPVCDDCGYRETDHKHGRCPRHASRRAEATWQRHLADLKRYARDDDYELVHPANLAPGDYLDGGGTVKKVVPGRGGYTVYFRVPGTPSIVVDGPVRRALPTHPVLRGLDHWPVHAGLERSADWTKYDDPEDPVAKVYGKPKPPSTSIAKQPRDWAKREPNGTWKGPAIPRKRK